MVNEIYKASHTSGMNCVQLAKRYGLTANYVLKIKREQAWASTRLEKDKVETLKDFRITYDAKERNEKIDLVKERRKEGMTMTQAVEGLGLTRKSYFRWVKRLGRENEDFVGYKSYYKKREPK